MGPAVEPPFSKVTDTERPVASAARPKPSSATARPVVQVATAAAGRFHLLTRVVALLDSDRLVPHGPAPGDRKRQRLDAVGKILVHVLALREAENYVPNRVLSRVPRQQSKVVSARLDCLKQLTPHQRGHFDMKHGFGDALDGDGVTGDQRHLYQGADPRVLRALREGFGRDLLGRLETISREGALDERDFAAIGPGVVAELRGLLKLLDSVI